MPTENERRQKRKYIFIIVFVGFFAVLGTVVLFVGGMGLAHWEALEQDRADLEWELVYGNSTSCEMAVESYRNTYESPFTALVEIAIDVEPPPSKDACPSDGGYDMYY